MSYKITSLYSFATSEYCIPEKRAKEYVFMSSIHQLSEKWDVILVHRPTRSLIRDVMATYDYLNDDKLNTVKEKLMEIMKHDLDHSKIIYNPKIWDFIEPGVENDIGRQRNKENE